MPPFLASIHQEELGLFDGCQRQGLAQGQFINYVQIESALLENPAVSEAGVVASNSAQCRPILRIYLALFQASKLEQANFCQEIEQFISTYFNVKIPIVVQIRDKLPMTRSGKICRSMLEQWN